MNKNNLRMLAAYVLKKDRIDKKVARQILTGLSRKNLSAFARILGRLASENTVKVLSEEKLPEAIRKTIVKKYPENNVVFLEDKKIGAGIKIMINDTIVDLSLGGYIDNTFKGLQTEI